MLLKLAATVLAVAVLSTPAMAQTYLVTPGGKYLGNLNSNKYDPNSVSNPYGQYGSKYSADSINNPYGQYGSKYSNESARNPYATQAPQVYAPCKFFCN